MLGQKKLAAALFAGVVGFGLMAGTGSAQAAPDAAQMRGYEMVQLASSNDFSERMRQEDLKHEQIVRSLRYEYRRDGDRAKYERGLREEQKRHDKAVKKIRRDYDSHARRHHK